MATRAIEWEVSAGQGKLSLGMVELRSLPACRAVADRTILRKARGHMVGVGGLLKVGEMTGCAIPRCSSEPPIGVALLAIGRGVRAGQCESRESAVIERRSGPTRSCVAQGAILREPRLHMVRIFRGVVVVQMAANAVTAGPLKVAADMTCRAVEARVGARERKAGKPVVIKGRAHPTVHAVALLAGGGKSRGPVVWNRRLRECLDVAGNTLG